MAKHRTHSTDFKRQVVQEYLAGETLNGLSNRHDLSRNLIRIWVEKYQAGGLDEDAAAADLLQSYEARIAALEEQRRRQPLAAVPGDAGEVDQRGAGLQQHRVDAMGAHQRPRLLQPPRIFGGADRRHGRGDVVQTARVDLGGERGKRQR